MTLRIDLAPDEERSLLEHARLSGQDAAQYVRQLIRDHIRAETSSGVDPIGELDDIIDYEAVASCAREIEGKAIPSIEEVRDALAKIPGSMTRAVIEDREDRF